ncbi:MAG TPA: hypothetical protein VLQ48_07460 [Chloroflexia bacterium]|nr:hypothetical protein [Chloroflexia bacterium]
MPNTDKAGGTRKAFAFLSLTWTMCAFLLILALAACSPQTAPSSQPAILQQAASATPALTETAPLPTATTIVAPASTVTATEALTATGVATGTAVVRPTPTGEPPANPYDMLQVFGFTSPGNLIIKRDRLPLDDGAVNNVLMTLTEARLGQTRPITEEVNSVLNVVTYNDKYFEWDLTWQSDPISGVARLLPAVPPPGSHGAIGGWNGGKLLGTDDRVIALRTTTLDGAAHLELFKWNKTTHAGEVLKMVPVGGGAEKDAIFDADLDINMADLNEDGVYEVVADNVAGVQVWSWDGSKYVPKAVQ